MSGTVNWKTAVSGDWNVGTNWAGGTVPPSAGNAVIGLSGSYDVTIATGETEGIASLSITNAAATFALDGLLNLSGTLSGVGAVIVSSGTLAGGTIASGTEVTFTDAYNFLSGVAVEGGLQVGSPNDFGLVVLTSATTIYAANGVSAGTITLGDNTGTTANGGEISFQNSSTIENFITAGGTAESDYIDAGGTLSGTVYPIATLTLGSLFVLQGGTDDSFTFRDNGFAVGFATVVNQGTISAGLTGDMVYVNTQGFINAGLMQATASGDMLQIEAGLNNAWSNTGEISVSGGADAYLGGTILALGTLVHTDTAEIYVTGVIANAGATLDAASALNGVLLEGGTIAGGTVLNGSDLVFDDVYSALAGVTVDGGLQVGSANNFGIAVLDAATTIYAADGVSPGTVTLGDDTGTTANGGDIYFLNSRTIETTITAGGTGETDYIDAGGTFTGSVYPVATLTLGSQFVLQGGTGDSFTFRDNGFNVGYASLVNQGTISAGPAEDVVYIVTQGFSNAGLMLAAGPSDALSVEDGTGTAWSNSGTITATGTQAFLVLGGTLTNTGSVSGSGSVSTLVNNKLVESTGSLVVTGSITGTGTLKIDAGDSFEIAAGAASGQTVLFGGGNNLILDTPTQFAGTLMDLAGGDTIDLPGTVAVSTAINGGTLGITLQGGTTLHVALSAPASGITAALAGSGTEVVIHAAPCFRAGTRLATPRGEVPVEELAPGDEVLTIDGTQKAIQWIGHRRIDCARHPQAWKVWPVRIAPHTFGRGCPRRPLYLSPDHAVFVEGVLIPIQHLITGTAIRQIRTSRVTYYHVELARHSVILAEGLTVESYLDTGDRPSFDNGASSVSLHPAWSSAARDVAAVFEAFGAAPLHVAGPTIDNARQQLGAALSKMLGRSSSTLI